MSQAKLPKISEETISRMLAAQAKEQEIKLRELEMRDRETREQANFVHKMLQAQAADRDSERSHEHSLLKMRLLFGGLVLFISLLFLGFIVWRGFAEYAVELAKIVIYGTFGAFGGYGYKAIQDKNKPQDKD